MEKFIYNFFNKTKGVISVFLVIVLVPIVTCCCLYVDAARIKLAKSVVESSGDLALNTVLSNFDADLAEIYGLMATAQDDKAVIAAAQEYFKKSMVSQGLDEAYADEFSKALSGMLNGSTPEDISDLLGIDTMGDVKINAVGDGNLTNPTILKAQIIEFMKYRGPVEGASELWDKFSEIRNNANDSKHVTKLTQDANKYYEHEKDALTALEKAYKQILDYNDINNNAPGTFHTISGINKDYVDNTKTKLTSKADGGIYSKYKKWHSDYVYDLCTYNQYNTGRFTGNTIKTPAGSYPAFNNIQNPTLNLLKTQLTGLQTSYKNYLIYSAKFNNFASVYSFKDGMRSSQYWIQAQKAFNNTDYSTAQFIKYYDGDNSNSIAYKIAKINKIAQNLDADKLSETASLPDVPYKDSSGSIVTPAKEQSYQEAIDSFNEAVNSQYSGGVYSKYNAITKKIAGFNGYATELENKKTNLNSGVKRISEDLTKRKDNIDTASAHLNLAYLYLNDAKTAIDEMNKSFETWTSDYNTALSGSSDSPKISGSKTKKEMKSQYDEAKKEIKDLGITSAEIEGFMGRVNNVKSLLGNVKTAIDALKYNSKYSDKKKSVSSIAAIDDFAGASGITYDKISMYQSDLDKLNSSSFSIDIPDVKNCNVTNNNNPNFMSNPHKIYLWMQGKFVDENGKMVDPRKKSENSDAEFKAEEEEEQKSCDNVDTSGNSNSKNDIKANCKNLPSGAANPDSGVEIKVEGKENIDNMADAVCGLFKDFGDSMLEMRDDLYILLYISNMFTHDTFEKELDFEKKENGGKEDKYARCTLTNVEMNEANNYAYGNEIEYIIYGNTNAANKVASYGTIFAVRYALDLLYAITNFWSPTKTDTGIAIQGIAASVAAATAGVIPIPLTKLVIILGLAGAEAASDISILKGGKPLAVIKTPNVWRCQVEVNSNLSQKEIENANIEARKNGEITFQYSDYLKLILMMKLIGNDKPILKRTADVIQVNMAMKNKGYLMKNCNVYYSLSATCRSPIMMLALPVVQGSLKESKIEVKTWNEYSVKLYRGY